jgi:hypothetical protein
MGLIIRKAAMTDASRWLDLVKTTLGEDYPDKQVYDPAWIAGQFNPSEPIETWVADVNGKLHASISILPPFAENKNRVCNLGRHLNHPSAYVDGSAEALLKKVLELSAERQQIAVSRVFASDNTLQALYENAGFACAGFQPFKHMHRVRENALFYVKMAAAEDLPRFPLSESLPQIAELAQAVLGQLKLSNPAMIRDGATGYPLHSELTFQDATVDDFELWRTQAAAANPPVEISGAFNQGAGFLRTDANGPPKAILAQKDGKFIAGVAYSVDALDRCVRLIDGFSQDDVAMGPLLSQAVKVAQGQNAIYVEMDALTTAPRLLKAAEQLGFVPIAYLPAFYSKGDRYADVVKLVKLNMVYALEHASFTTNSKAIAQIIDENFQDQKMGIAIINLLRALPFFEGLGDGELRKIARLFTQKLYRPAEKIFNKGDSGNEAYVVMRGQIDIVFEEGSKPIATLGNGTIFGELAFLDGTPRSAMAIPSQASILLVIQRSAFNDLVQREPHLGMVVMRNIALELSNRLKKANAALAGKK